MNNKEFMIDTILDSDFEMIDITDHYELVEVEVLALFETIEEARCHAVTDRHLWFVRHSDEEPEYKGDNDPTFLWHVEGWRGQFVNRLGYCVTTEPRKPEHDETIFGY